MKKVIILTYYFLPGNFAGSYRMGAWVKHLHKFGIHPIVITRHWNENEIDFSGISNVKEKTIETTAEYTIIKVPYKGSIRDKMIYKFGSRASLLGKVFSFFQLIFQNIKINSAPQNELYWEARRLLQDDHEIEIIITSGKPFILFKFCYELKKKFPRIQWIADYRDPWQSEQKKFSIKEKILRKVESPFEQKWIRSSAHITTVSKGIADGLRSLHGFEKSVSVIKNGFNEYVPIVPMKRTNLFEIGYIGSLYPNQNIEVFLEGYKKFISDNNIKNITLNFYGLNEQSVLRVKQSLRDYSTFYKIIPRLPKSQLLELIQGSICFLLCGMPHRKGTYTAKFMDYLSLKKPIILCPSDFDVLESAINLTNTGFILNSKEEVEVKLKKMYKEWKRDGFLKFEENADIVDSYKNENQVRYLSELINSLTDNKL